MQLNQSDLTAIISMPVWNVNWTHNSSDNLHFPRPRFWRPLIFPAVFTSRFANNHRQQYWPCWPTSGFPVSNDLQGKHKPMWLCSLMVSVDGCQHKGLGFKPRGDKCFCPEFCHSTDYFINTQICISLSIHTFCKLCSKRLCHGIILTLFLLGKWRQLAQ